MTNRTEKYGIKMLCDQFGTACSSNFDPGQSDEISSEKKLIDVFEKRILELADLKKDSYTMVELGSNYAFYSMMFKKILGGTKTTNWMVEPYEKYYQLGVKHFAHNGLSGHFLKKAIFDPAPWCGRTFETPVITIDELLEEYDVPNLDILHMDIDGTEYCALDGAEKSLSEKKIDTLFILTHPCRTSGKDLHEPCKELLTSYNYRCTTDHPEKNIGWDGLLVFERN